MYADCSILPDEQESLQVYKRQQNLHSPPPTLEIEWRSAFHGNGYHDKVLHWPSALWMPDKDVHSFHKTIEFVYLTLLAQSKKTEQHQNFPKTLVEYFFLPNDS